MSLFSSAAIWQRKSAHYIRQSSWLTLGVVGILAACHDTDSVTPLAVSQGKPQSVRADVGSLGRIKLRPEEAAMADLAVNAPSSAGFYFDVHGTLMVNVRDQLDDAAGRAKMASMLGQGRIGGTRGAATPIAIQRVTFTFAQLAEWRDIVFDSLLTREAGLSWLDLDEEHNRVAVGIVPESWTQMRSSLPGRMQRWGIDTNAVAFHKSGYVKNTTAAASTAPAFFPVRLDTIADTVVAGVRFAIHTSPGSSTYWPCTLGFVATSSGTLGYVTASHCTPSEFSTDYSVAAQTEYGSAIGWETNDPAGYTCGIRVCRGSDASFFSSYGARTSPVGLIARTTYAAPPHNMSGSKTVDSSHPYFFITSADNADSWVGMNVQMMAQVSGWASGAITQTCLDHVNPGGTWGWSGYVTTCSYGASYGSQGGDSGAPVFSFLSSNGSVTDLVKLAGVNFGIMNDASLPDSMQTRVFSGFQRIQNDLGTLNVTRPTTLSTPSVSGSVSGGDPYISWSAISGASTYIIREVSFDGSTVTTSYIARTSSTFYFDGPTLVTSYAGTTQPSSGTWARYDVYAMSSGIDMSAPSTPVYFVTTTSCTGRC